MDEVEIPGSTGPIRPRPEDQGARDPQGRPRRGGSVATRVVQVGDLSITYDHQVLEPRPWTAIQGEWIAELAHAAPMGPILEVCAGAGHIGLVAAHRSGRRLVQVDREPHACALARINASRAGMGDRVDVRCRHLDDVLAMGELFPLVIADPPYIASASVGRYPDDPRVAIDGGQDGLDLARSFIELIRAVLLPEGSAVLQLGSVGQLDAMADFARPELELVERRSAGSTRFLGLFEHART